MLQISLSRFEKILMGLLSNPNIYPANSDYAVVNMAIRIEQAVKDSAAAALMQDTDESEEVRPRGRPKKS